MTGALNPARSTSAFRIHNGVATGAAAARRIEATNSGGTDVVGALPHPEQPGGAGLRQRRQAATSSWPCPSALAFDAKIQNVIWPALAASFTGSLADVDIALGAADTTPPAAPSYADRHGR